MKKLILMLVIFSFLLIGAQSFAQTTVWVDYLGVLNTDITKKTSLGHLYSGLYKWEVGGWYVERYCHDILNTAMDFNAITGIPSTTNKLGKLWGSSYSSGLSDDIILEKYSMIGWLWGNIHPGLDKFGRGNLNLAIWEVGKDYDGTAASLNLDPSSANKGTFYVNSGTHSIQNTFGLANNWLADAYTYGRTGFVPQILTPGNPMHAQEIIIPEPGTILLLGIGLFGFGVFSKYRRRKIA